MSLQIQYLTQQLYIQTIADHDTDIGNYFYDLPGTYASRNTYIFPDEEKNPLRIIDVADIERVAGVVCQGGQGES